MVQVKLHLDPFHLLCVSILYTKDIIWKKGLIFNLIVTKIRSQNKLEMMKRWKFAWSQQNYVDLNSVKFEMWSDGGRIMQTRAKHRKTSQQKKEKRKRRNVIADSNLIKASTFHLINFVFHFTHVFYSIIFARDV